MNPYFAERVAAERRKDLMREADRWRLAHAQGPKAHRRATWWPLRAGAGRQAWSWPMPRPWRRLVPDRGSSVPEPNRS